MIIEVAVKYKELEDIKWGEKGYGVLADLDGLLYGYYLQEIFDYCIEKKPHLVK